MWLFFLVAGVRQLKDKIIILLTEKSDSIWLVLFTFFDKAFKKDLELIFHYHFGESREMRIF